MKTPEHGSDLASLQKLVDSLPALIFANRPDGYLDFCNQRMLDYVGLPFEDLEGWKWGVVVHPDDVTPLTERWQASLASGEPFECEARVRRADGEYRWMLHREVAVRDGLGQVVRWYGSSIDIEDRKRAEFEVRKHEAVHVTLEAQLQATLNLIPAQTWYAAPSGALTFLNQRCADYLGLPSDHPLRFGVDTGVAWDAHIPLLHPDDQEGSRRDWSTSLRTGCAGEGTFRVRSAAGAYRWFVSRAEPLRANDGTLLFWIGVNVDIEEQKRAEFYLAEGQRLAHTGSWAFNAAGFNYWSPELFAIHGLPPNGKAPTTAEYLSLVHPDDREFMRQAIGKMRADDGGFDFTKRIVRPDGDTRSLRYVGIPVTHGGAFQEFVGTAVDVTEHEQFERERERLRRLEADLAHRNRVSMMGEMAASLAHEIRQPIAAARIDAKVCLRAVADSRIDVDAARESASRIVNAVIRADEIVKRTTALYKNDTTQRQRVDVNAVIREMTVLLRQEAVASSITIRTSLAEGISDVMADRVQLQQVFMNLMLNAIDAMRGTGGELTIMSQMRGGREALIGVSDTGVGLPVDNPEQIFESFVTTKPDGTGMGLTITRSIVESHGGRLWAISNSGPGATFLFTVPTTGETLE